MPRIPLSVWLNINRLHCYDEGDGIGNAEPYLWTVFFKIDGDTVVLGDDLHLHGTVTIMPTPGSHGNLGDTDVDAGDNVFVPGAIGQWQTTLRPIPVPALLADVLHLDKVGGAVGVVAVLMEEDWVSDAGAEAGHQALNTFIEQAINSLIPTLGILHSEVTDEDINQLTDGAPDKISDAVADAQGAWDNFASWLNADDHIGTKVWTFSHDTLGGTPATATTPAIPATPDIDFSQRFDNEGDWELFGHIHASPTCPADAVGDILKALGLISDAQARMAHAAMDGFRRTAFAGQAGLGAWWQLAERNVAGIASVLRANPELAKRSAAAMFQDIVAALGSEKPLPDSLLSHASELLEQFASKGPRRLRIDAKAALAMLPELKGKTLKAATDTLNRRNPTRKIKRLPRRSKT
jgi:hypothetical protein